MWVIGVVIVFVFVIIIVGVASQKNREEFEALQNEDTRKLPKEFEPSRIIEFEETKFVLDVTNQQIAVSSNYDEPYTVVEFKKILDCSVVMDENIVCNARGSIAGAVAGGLLFGGAGAIVGSTANRNYTTSKSIRSLIVRLKIDDILKPVIDIIVVNRIIKNKDDEYTEAFRFAEEVYSTIDLGLKKQKKKK